MLNLLDLVLVCTKYYNMILGEKAKSNIEKGTR